MRPVCHSRLTISAQFEETRAPACPHSRGVTACQSAALSVGQRKSDARPPAEHPLHFLTEIDDLGECSGPFDSANRRRKPIEPKELKSGAGRGNRTPTGLSSLRILSPTHTHQKVL